MSCGFLQVLKPETSSGHLSIDFDTKISFLIDSTSMTQIQRTVKSL